MKMVDYIYVQALSLKNYENDDTTLYIYTLKLQKKLQTGHH